MGNVTQLATRTQSTLKQNSWIIPITDDCGKTLSGIDRLYNRFDGLYLQKWKSNFPNPKAVDNWKESWSDALARNGISLRAAFDGILKCEELFPWPPSLPEFLALCKPQFDYEHAYLDAIRMMNIRHNGGEDQWPHPAIYWAAVDFGQFELRNSTYSTAAARWKKLLDARLATECPDVPTFMQVLPAPARNEEGHAITSDEAKAQAREAIAKLAIREPSLANAVERARAVIANHKAGKPVPTFKLNHAHAVIDSIRGAGK